jgi:hypothetical protein
MDPLTLDAKLEAFDWNAEQAVDEIIDWLTRHRGDLIAVARGRHVTGHYLYADRNFAEWDTDRLRKEAAEELADAIVYLTRIIDLHPDDPVTSEP